MYHSSSFSRYFDQACGTAAMLCYAAFEMPVVFDSMRAPNSPYTGGWPTVLQTVTFPVPSCLEFNNNNNNNNI